MICWHCNREMELNFLTADAEKFYHCDECDKWYELSKEKARVNGAVPVRFIELENRPPVVAAAQMFHA